MAGLVAGLAGDMRVPVLAGSALMEGWVGG